MGKKRAVYAMAATVLLCGALIWQLALLGKNIVTAVTAAPVNDWGLGFGEAGTQPRGNCDAEYLKQFDSYFIGNAEEKVIYLTFDAGDENGYTAAILDVLKKQEVPAAFFVVSNYVKDNPELVKRMSNEGHIVGNHTMTHPDMSKITDQAAFAKELNGLAELIEQTTGKPMQKFYRPPAGRFSEQNLQFAKDLGYKTIFWSLAYADWDVDKQPTHQTAFDKLYPRMHNGCILLLHSTSQTNAEILDELITKWKNEGYTFRSLDALC